MKKILSLLMALFMLTLSYSVNIEPVQADTTVYINQEARVPIKVSFPKPVAGFYHLSTGVSGTIGDPLNENYVTSVTVTAVFTPTKLGTQTITVTFDVSDAQENSISVAAKTETVTVTNPPAPKSTNNFLSSLTTNVGTINFNKNTNNYTLIVAHNVTSATISATAEDAKATVSGAGAKNLAVYSNNIPIRVTAENGAVRTYNVNLVRRDADGLAGPLSKNNNLSTLVVDGCDIDFNTDVLQYKCEVENLVDSVVIVATAEDSKASVNIDQVKSLKVGNNEIKITVTAESEDKKVYVVNINRSGTLPTISQEELRNALENLPGDEIVILEDGRLSEASLRLIKEHGITLFVNHVDESNQTRYIWKFSGKDLTTISEVKTRVEFDNETLSIIDELTNHAKGLLVSFEANPNLPEHTEVGIYVGDRYEDGTVVQVYYHNKNENKLELKFTDLIVEEGYVWLPIVHTSDYFITVANLNDEALGYNPWLIVTIGLSAILIGLIGYIVKIELDKRKVN